MRFDGNAAVGILSEVAEKETMAVVLATVVTGILTPIVAKAQTPVTDAPSQFRFELTEAESHRGRAVEGYVYNGLPWGITNVRLRVESVDRSGTVTGEASGWVIGDVKPGGRGYFFVPVSSRAAAYRATVQSFDKVAREAPRVEAP
jgi:hypothetical protein